jgi:hypothetical protein
MTDSALQSLQRSIDELASAVAVLSHTHGKIPIVARLCNDLERLKLDVTDARTLRAPATPAGPSAPAETMFKISDEPYDQSMWGDDADQEGVGGYHGKSR